MVSIFREQNGAYNYSQGTKWCINSKGTKWCENSLKTICCKHGQEKLYNWCIYLRREQSRKVKSVLTENKVVNKI